MFKLKTPSRNTEGRPITNTAFVWLTDLSGKTAHVLTNGGASVLFPRIYHKFDPVLQRAAVYEAQKVVKLIWYRSAKSY